MNLPQSLTAARRTVDEVHSQLSELRVTLLAAQVNLTPSERVATKAALEAIDTALSELECGVDVD